MNVDSLPTMHLCAESFSFVCNRRWAQLAELPDPAVRYCDRCQRTVHKVRTREEFDLALREGRCIAWLRDHRSRAPGPDELLGEVIDP